MNQRMMQEFCTSLSDLLSDSARLAEAKEEVEMLRKDAARYRWLRDSKNAYPLFFIAQRDPNNVVVQFTGDLADMNIDEMMKTPNVEVQGRAAALAPRSVPCNDGLGGTDNEGE